MHLCANISLLFADRPLPERVMAAAACGFDSVEIQFPDPSELKALRHASETASCPFELVNVPRGANGELGLAALPAHQQDYREAVSQACDMAMKLAVSKVNVLAGCPPDNADRSTCTQVLVDNLCHTADVMGQRGIQVMVEVINAQDVPGFFLYRLDQALEILDRAAHPNLYLQFDLYHMTLSETDLVTAIHNSGPRIGHVQFADAPGRHAPGSGKIDFASAIQSLRETGYDGALSAEYWPEGRTEGQLEWISAFRASMK